MSRQKKKGKAKEELNSDMLVFLNTASNEMFFAPINKRIDAGFKLKKGVVILLIILSLCLGVFLFNIFKDLGTLPALILSIVVTLGLVIIMLPMIYVSLFPGNLFRLTEMDAMHGYLAGFEERLSLNLESKILKYGNNNIESWINVKKASYKMIYEFIKFAFSAVSVISLYTIYKFITDNLGSVRKALIFARMACGSAL